MIVSIGQKKICIVIIIVVFIQALRNVMGQRVLLILMMLVMIIFFTVHASVIAKYNMIKISFDYLLTYFVFILN